MLIGRNKFVENFNGESSKNFLNSARGNMLRQKSRFFLVVKKFSETLN